MLDIHSRRNLLFRRGSIRLVLLAVERAERFWGSGMNDDMYAETTRKITVKVEPQFLDEQSDPDERHYVWAYTVRIENRGGKTVQLLNR